MPKITTLKCTVDLTSIIAVEDLDTNLTGQSICCIHLTSGKALSVKCKASDVIERIELIDNIHEVLGTTEETLLTVEGDK